MMTAAKSAVLLAHPCGLQTIALLSVVEMASALAVVEGNAPISTNSELRAFCIIGATFGAWIGVLAFQPKKGGWRAWSAKLLISLLTGIAFTPLALRWSHMPLDADYALGVSSMVSLGSRFVIRGVLNFWRRKGGNFEPPQE